MKTLYQSRHRFINEETTNHYEWKKSSKSAMLLDKEGMEQSSKDKVENYLKAMGLMEQFLRGYIRELLHEASAQIYRR